MNDRDKQTDLIEEISSIVVMADADDKESLKSLQSFAKELQELTEGADSNQPALVQFADWLGPIAKNILRKKKENVEKDLTVIGDKLTELQVALRAPVPTPSESPTPDEREVEEGEFELPTWVDEEVFDEFISNQRLVLDEIEGDILDLEKNGPKARSEIKRRLHTLKGESGLVGLEDVETVCHAIEDFLEGSQSIKNVVDTLLLVRDWICAAIESYANMRLPDKPGDVLIAEHLEPGEDKPPLESDAISAGNISEPCNETTSISVEDEKEPEKSSTAAQPPPPEEVGDESSSWDDETIELIGEFLQESEEGLGEADDVLMSIEESGAEPEKVNSLFRTFHTIKGVAGFLELKEITMLAHTTETMLNLVREGELEIHGPVLDLVFDSTEMMRNMLADVKTAIEQSTNLAPMAGQPELLKKLSAVIERKEVNEETLPLAQAGEKLGEILPRPPTMIPQSVIQDALVSQKDTGRRLGEELVATGAAKPKQVSQALRAQNRADGNSASKIKETVKVDLDRVDNLVEMIGELVIVESMVVNSPEISGIVSQKVRNYLGQLGKITHDLQDVGMRMRMVPVRGVFQKMARMVRDLSRKSGKDIRFVSSGEGTEMDRSMVERVTDPLVHMIRNSVDHGIEPSEDRVKAGKPKTGTVSLSAYHEGGSVVIEIADNGRGLDKENILKKAIKQGLISEGEVLSDDAIYKLIFAPGFSTAKQVTEISGRGVGMDVVKKNLDAMRGRVSITSTPGEGSTFKLILPLTLAIIEGMLVASGSEKYIIPTLSIVESIQPEPSMLVTFAEKGELMNVRGQVIPLIRLDALFSIPDAKKNSMEGLIVIVEGVGRKFGLFLDEVLTQQQVVIKTLGECLGKTEFVSGAAIMSDGRVGLILNIDELGSFMEERMRESRKSAEGGMGSSSSISNNKTNNAPLPPVGMESETGVMEVTQ